MCGVFFYFFPEGCHENSEGSEIAVKCIAPDGICQVCVGKCLADILTEQAQQFVLYGREGQFLPVHVCSARGKIYLQISVFEDMGVHVSLGGGKAPLGDTQSRKEFIHGERLGQIVVRAGIQGLNSSLRALMTMIGTADQVRILRIRSTPSMSGSPRSRKMTSGLWDVICRSASEAEAAVRYL